MNAPEFPNLPPTVVSYLRSVLWQRIRALVLTFDEAWRLVEIRGDAAYYGIEFLVNGICFMVLTVVLALLYGAILDPVLSASLLIAVAAGYLCYAGLGFALSALSRWDWLSLVAVAGAADVLWTFYGASSSPFAVLLRLFPPVNRTSAIYAAAASGMALPWHSVLWLAGYGAIAFVAGLAILRHRRLAFN